MKEIRPGMHHGTRIKGTDLNGEVFVVPKSKSFGEKFDAIRWNKDGDVDSDMGVVDTDSDE